MVVRLVLINRISLQQCRPVNCELRPRIKCGAVKLTSDRAMQTDTNTLLLAGIGKHLDCEPLSWLPRALWSGGSGFAVQGSGRALAPVHLAAPSLCPENPGPGLCFLPRNFPGWPCGHGIWNPACFEMAYGIRHPIPQSPEAQRREREEALVRWDSRALPLPLPLRRVRARALRAASTTRYAAQRTAGLARQGQGQRAASAPRSACFWAPLAQAR
jgi:hypothetical protein